MIRQGRTLGQTAALARASRIALDPVEAPVDDTMTELQPAPLEPGRRPVERRLAAVLPARMRHERAAGFEHGIHLLRISGPVGSQVEASAGREAVCDELHETRLDEAPFVMPLFRPGIGKPEIDAVQRIRRKLVLEDWRRVR